MITGRQFALKCIVSIKETNGVRSYLIPFFENTHCSILLVLKILNKKGKNAGNEGSQVEFEQIVQTVSLVLQTHFRFGYFYPVLYLLVPWIGSPCYCNHANRESNPWDKVPQYPVYFTCPIVKQVTVNVIILKFFCFSQFPYNIVSACGAVLRLFSSQRTQRRAKDAKGREGKRRVLQVSVACN